MAKQKQLDVEIERTSVRRSKKKQEDKFLFPFSIMSLEEKKSKLEWKTFLGIFE
jgi:hypothetical protein